MDNWYNVGNEEPSWWGDSNGMDQYDWAVYEYRDIDEYNGGGDIVFYSNEKLYHMSLDHCSCYGPLNNDLTCLGTPEEVFATEGRSIFDEDLSYAIKDKVKELLAEKKHGVGPPK